MTGYSHHPDSDPAFSSRSLPLKQPCFSKHYKGSMLILLSLAWETNQTFCGCTLVFLYLKGLFPAKVVKHLRAIGRTHPLSALIAFSVLFVFSALSRIVLLPSTWQCLLSSGQWRRKQIGTCHFASFNTSQPVINASTVVRIRFCRVICLSLS